MKCMTATLTVIGLVAAAAAMAQAPTPLIVVGDIVQAGGRKIGDVTLTGAPTGVLLRLTASGLTPGWHAMHFHAAGDCSDQGFQKSGAHINHDDHKKPHGLLNPEGPDFGELPNIYVAADGRANAEAFSTLVSLASGSTRPNLLDGNGSALVIYASADDHASQPIGGAGVRIACAAFRASP